MKNKKWFLLLCLSVLIMSCSGKKQSQTGSETPQQQMNSGGNATPQTEAGNMGQQAAGDSGSVSAPSDTGAVAPH